MGVGEDIGPHERAALGEEETRKDDSVAYTAVSICLGLKFPRAGGKTFSAKTGKVPANQHGSLVL